VELLLKSRANPRFEDKDGTIPMLMTRMNGYDKVVDILKMWNI
jgi:hypothetical protein